MRDWKRWTAVLLAGSLAFTAADDMKCRMNKDRNCIRRKAKVNWTI